MFRITHLHIENFRSIKCLDLELDDTTVFIGPNNSGKTAILDAVRIVLTRRWGRRGSGFTEHDVHRADSTQNPRTAPPIAIGIRLEESEIATWDDDLVAALEDITVLSEGRNVIVLQVTCLWREELEAFEPAWEFLNEKGESITGRARRAINLSNFFDYLPLFWLGALRDASDEFAPGSSRWGRLLRSVHLPEDKETKILETLKSLDEEVISSSDLLNKIAERIGDATQVAINEGPGSASLNTLPLTIEDMLQRTGIVMRNEEQRPWFPLSQHGQGLQSLAVIFLFQAVAAQQLEETEFAGMRPVFTIEEPEAHLHPQAARTLWKKIQELNGQKLIATHSPYFAQHVPVHALRLVRLERGRSEVVSVPRQIISQVQWNENIENFVSHHKEVFVEKNGRVAATTWFSERMAAGITGNDPGSEVLVEEFRHACRLLLSEEEEKALEFNGRRLRGEIFFAQRWLLVEGLTEYLLVHALGKAFDWDLDTHGVSVIDFQQSAISGGPAVYVALAEALRIPWHMIVDGDGAGKNFCKSLLKRGFRAKDLHGKIEKLPNPNFEAQLIADAEESLLKAVLEKTGVDANRLTTPVLIQKELTRQKVIYMGVLAPGVAQDQELAKQMPAPFVNFIKDLRDGKR